MAKMSIQHVLAQMEAAGAALTLHTDTVHQGGSADSDCQVCVDLVLACGVDLRREAGLERVLDAIDNLGTE